MAPQRPFFFAFARFTTARAIDRGWPFPTVEPTETRRFGPEDTAALFGAFAADFDTAGRLNFFAFTFGRPPVGFTHFF